MASVDFTTKAAACHSASGVPVFAGAKEGAFVRPSANHAVDVVACFDLCSDDDINSSSASTSSPREESSERSTPIAAGEGSRRRRGGSGSTSDCCASGRSCGRSTDLGDEECSWPPSSPTLSVDGASSDSESEATAAADAVSPMTMLLASRAMLCGMSREKAGVRPSSELGCTFREEAKLPCGVLAKNSIPADVKATLAPSPSSWAAARQQQLRAGADASGLEEEAENERIVRAARSILNKLTVEKFDALYEQLATCGIRNTDQLRTLMREVFEKATGQHHFIPMYADLCVRLESEERIAAALNDGAEDRSDKFRRLLLDRCQRAFEELLESRSGDEDLDDEAKLIRKQRALGNVKLVGQLIVRGMLSSRLLIRCAEDLLEARAHCAEALESLAAFLTVAAPPFDVPAFAQRQHLEAIFRRMSELSADRSVLPRERFLLRDVLDLRSSGWAGKACAAKPSAPMRLEEVRVAASAAEASPVVSRSPKGVAGRAQPSRSRPEPPRAPPSVRAPQPKCRTLAKREPTTPQAARAAAAVPAKVEAPVASPAAAPQPATPPAPVPAAAFDPKVFRKVLSETMRELAQGGSVTASVQRVREQQVPLARQAAEFADILTRASEEMRGPTRRSAFAFAAGLCAADGTSAFDRSACLDGVALYLREVYPDLCEEVPRLPSIVKAELLPTLRSVLPETSLRRVAPTELWLR